MDITYKLPHPVRSKCSEATEKHITLQDGVYDQILESIDLEDSGMDFIVNTIVKGAPNLWEAYKSQSDTDHNAFIGLSTSVIPYKFRRLDGNILTTSNDIDKLLEKTEIGDDIPIAYLRPPFKNCYIEFTEDRSSSLKVYNEETQEHILEGVYISESVINPGSKAMDFYKSHAARLDITKPLRVLDLMFTGSPIGKSHNNDDALRIQGFYIQDNSITIKEELKRVEGLYGNDDDFAGDIDYLSATLNHMAKVLLFVNCKQYRDTAFNERQEIIKKVDSLKSPSKIKKYEKKLRKAYDRLIIKPEDHVIYEKSGSKNHSEGHAEKRTHWRKGHFRMQPYGVGATKRKVIFIEPTVVGGVFAKKKPYTVKDK